MFSRALCCSTQRQSGHSHGFSLTLLMCAVLWGGPQACPVAMVLSGDLYLWLPWLPSLKLLVQGLWICASEARAACGPWLPKPLPSPCGPLPPNSSKMFGCSSLPLVCVVKGLSLKYFSQLETFIGLSFMLKKSWQP